MTFESIQAETRRLKVSTGLPDPIRRALANELAEYGFQQSESGRTTYGGQGAHDDLVTALSIATWAAGQDNGAAARASYVRRVAAGSAPVLTGIVDRAAGRRLPPGIH